MADTLKVLGQTAPADTNEATLYNYSEFDCRLQPHREHAYF
jgi:hypothetical protein